jgi:hypothetical protein
MSKLYVTEYATLAQANGIGQAAQAPALAVQVLDFSSAHKESAAFNAKTTFVRLHTDAVCCIQFGTAPTAVSGTDARMAADQTEYFGVPVGQSYKVSVASTT